MVVVITLDVCSTADVYVLQQLLLRNKLGV
jgi:hypothetical protein